MIATIPWIALTSAFLSCVTQPEAIKTEGSCLYLLPLFVENFNRSNVDEVTFDFEYVPANFTIIWSTLSLICEELLKDNKELVVGESSECTGGSFDSTFAGADEIAYASKNTAIITDVTMSPKGGPNYTRYGLNNTPSKTRSPQDSIPFTSSIFTTQTTKTYRISNVTYRNISDMCPKPESQQYWQRDAAYWIRRVYPKVVAALGLPGNILTLVTIMTMKPLTSTSLFIAALAVSDNCALTTKLLYFELSRRQHTLSTPICGFLFWMAMGWGLFSLWLVVLVTIERFLAVWFPLRVKNLCTKKKTLIVITTTWVVIIGLNSHMMWTMVYGGLHCVINPDYANPWTALLWLYAIFSSIIPAPMILILNCAIVVGLRRSQATRKKMNVRTDDVSENKNSQRQITVMLLATGFVYIILTSPLAMLTVFRPRWDTSKTYEYSKLLLIDSIVNCLMDINLAINFYVYFLAGGKFRGQISNMRGCLFGRMKSRACNKTAMAADTTRSRSTSVPMVFMTSMPMFEH